MKKVIILLMFLILASSMFAQNINQNDVISANGINSTATALDSAGVFTGKAEQVIYMTSITIFIKSDQAGTGEVQFSSNGTNWDHKIPFTYTAADTTTNVYYFDVRGRYFRVIYTNGTTDQTYFRMQTWYHKQMIIPLKDKKVVVADDSASTKLDSIITNLLTQIARLDSIMTDGATSKGYLLAIKDSLNLSIAQLLAGLKGSSNKTLTDVESAVLGLQTASETLQDVINGIAGTSPNTNTLYDLKQVLDDIQTAAESIKDTDGIKKITDPVTIGSITSSTNNYAKEHTTVAAADSAVFGFTTKYVTFINDGATTDTLYVSSDPLFPATNTIKRVGSEGFTKPYGVTKLYFKVGATPQASKKIRIEAN